MLRNRGNNAYFLVALVSLHSNFHKFDLLLIPVFFYGFGKSGILDGFSKNPVFFHTKRAAGEIFEYFTSLSTDFLMFFHLF